MNGNKPTSLRIVKRLMKFFVNVNRKLLEVFYIYTSPVLALMVYFKSVFCLPVNEFISDSMGWLVNIIHGYPSIAACHSVSRPKNTSIRCYVCPHEKPFLNGSKTLSEFNIIRTFWVFPGFIMRRTQTSLDSHRPTSVNFAIHWRTS